MRSPSPVNLTMELLLTTKKHLLMNRLSCLAFLPSLPFTIKFQNSFLQSLLLTKFRASSPHLRSQISSRRSRSSPQKSSTKVSDGQSGRLTKNAPQMRPQRREVSVKATATMATRWPTIADLSTPKTTSTVTTPKTPPYSPSNMRSAKTIQRSSRSNPFLTTLSMVRMPHFWGSGFKLIFQE